METFIQPKITGYRQLSEAEVALMNEGKALAEQCGAYIAKLRAHGDTARGFMAVIRGIAQPTSF